MITATLARCVLAVVFPSTALAVEADSLATPQAADQAEVLPPTSKCPRDRRLPSAIRYAVLPLTGDVDDTTLAKALERFAASTPATKGVNALVIEFNATSSTQEAVDAIEEQLTRVRKRMPVIGVLGKCAGPAAELPLFCDYLLVTGSAADALIDWAPGTDLPDERMAQNIERHVAAAGLRSAERAYFTAIVKGLSDPSIDLYLWRGSDGCPEAGPKAPAGSTSVELAKGTDVKTAIDGTQLITSGLAIAVPGGVREAASALGVKSFVEQAGVGAAIVKEIADAEARESTQARDTLKRGFTAVKDARNLVGALIEAESIAREQDPRRKQFTGAYTRSWSGSRWVSSTGGTFAWQKNCDAAIASWTAAIAIYDTASKAASVAQSALAAAAKSPLAASDPDFKADLQSLKDEVDALMTQSGMLTLKGQNARKSVDWLRANYNTPVR